MEALLVAKPYRAEPVVEGPANSQNEVVFVYGTLRSTECNHGMMQGSRATFLGLDKILAKKIEGLAYPAIVDGDDQVDGELYAVDAEGLRGLDWFEGHPAIYRRREVKTVNGMKAWAYYGNGILPRLNPSHGS